MMILIWLQVKNILRNHLKEVKFQVEEEKKRLDIDRKEEKDLIPQVIHPFQVTQAKEDIDTVREDK